MRHKFSVILLGEILVLLGRSYLVGVEGVDDEGQQLVDVRRKCVALLLSSLCISEERGICETWSVSFSQSKGGKPEKE